MEIIILAIVASTLFVSLIIALELRKKNAGTAIRLDEKDKAELKQAFSQNVGLIASSLKEQSQNNNKVVDVQLENMSKRIKEDGEIVEKRLSALEQTQAQKMENIRLTLERNVQSMQQSNEKKLSEIQKTVDEKLTSTLNDRFKESFSILSSQLDSVTKTVGEITKISSDVGSLTRALTNGKTTGIFGEIQLGAIIEQILAPEQYLRNVVTNKASRDPVEFVVKMPGVDDNAVLLPIDSKFPYVRYSEMQKAYDENDFITFETRKKELIATVKSMAKDIKTKYICPPTTTSFAIMFLPIEGLYAEIVKLGLVETLQKEYSVTVAGPTTMSALLNSLQMGFQTLAVQKKSADVWNVLENVKMEFDKFEKVVESIQKKFNGITGEFDDLVGRRARAIQRKLRDVQTAQIDAPSAVSEEKAQ